VSAVGRSLRHMASKRSEPPSDDPDAAQADDSGRLDLPVYLDAGVALSLAASLGLVTESTIETAVVSDGKGGFRARAGVGAVLSVDGQIGGSRSVAVTENEVRKHTQASIFNAVRSRLERTELLKAPSSPWIASNWQVGEFVDFRAGRIVVPLVSVLSRLRVIAESFAYATTELSPELLQERIPRLLHQMRSQTGSDEAGELTIGADTSFDGVLSLISEAGELAGAVAGVIQRLESEAQTSGLVDVVMLEHHHDTPDIIAVASLDRDYVDSKLLRRLGQSSFNVLGKVLRAPEEGTAVNVFRNSMLGATSQFSVQLQQFASLLSQLSWLVGEGVRLEDGGEGTSFTIVGSAAAIMELNPLWLQPSIEIFPIAIYA
jgi:hypothetical protein